MYLRAGSRPGASPRKTPRHGLTPANHSRLWSVLPWNFLLLGGTSGRQGVRVTEQRPGLSPPPSLAQTLATTSRSSRLLIYQLRTTCPAYVTSASEHDCTSNNKTDKNSQPTEGAFHSKQECPGFAGGTEHPSGSAPFTLTAGWAFVPPVMEEETKA